MGFSQVQFNSRLKSIVRRHDRMKHGVAHVMTRDGLIVARPRRRMPSFPLGGVLTLLVTAFLFKGLMYFSAGALAYADRVASLQDGNMMERAGAWVLQADPATVMVANVFHLFLG